jgi:hypothetical protein
MVATRKQKICCGWPDNCSCRDVYVDAFRMTTQMAVDLQRILLLRGYNSYLMRRLSHVTARIGARLNTSRKNVRLTCIFVDRSALFITGRAAAHHGYNKYGVEQEAAGELEFILLYTPPYVYTDHSARANLQRCKYISTHESRGAWTR